MRVLKVIFLSIAKISLTSAITVLVSATGLEFLFNLTSSKPFEFSIPSNFFDWTLLIFWVLYPTVAKIEKDDGNPDSRILQRTSWATIICGFVIAVNFYQEALTLILFVGAITLVLGLLGIASGPQGNETEAQWEARMRKEKAETELYEDHISERLGNGRPNAERNKLLRPWKFW